MKRFFFQRKQKLPVVSGSFPRVNENLCCCYLDAALLSPFLHRPHGDHTSPDSSLLPHCLLYSLTDNITILLPQLSTLLSLCFVYTEKQKKHLSTFLIFHQGYVPSTVRENITTTINPIVPQVKEINTKREVKNNCLVMGTCIPHLQHARFGTTTARTQFT